MNPTEQAYIAGILDGEGHISIYGRSDLHKRGTKSIARFTLRVNVCMTSESVIRWLHVTTGLGHFSTHVRSDHFRTLYSWRVSSREAATLLAEVRQFLILKKRHAEIAAEFYETIGVRSLRVNRRKYLSQETAQKRIALIDEIRSLNFRRNGHTIAHATVHNVPNDLRVPCV